MKAQEAWRGYADAEALARVTVRLCEPEEREKWDAVMHKGTREDK